MKHYFIHKENHPSLTLFFAGWGMDEHPFMDYIPQGSDLLVCYDYRSLDFDFALLEGYREIRLVGWSMGVWAASQVLQHKVLPIKESIAVNGTLTPIDDHRGIPEAVFNGTLEGMDERTLSKFNRRMCLSGEGLKQFLGKQPQRTADELKEELRHIGGQVCCLPVPSLEWDKAVIGKEDLIFPADNQQNAWKETGAEIAAYPFPHYSDELLRKIIVRQ